MSNDNILTEIWAYLKTRKKWWLTPIILTLLLISLLILLGQSSSVSPLVYTFF